MWMRRMFNLGELIERELSSSSEGTSVSEFNYAIDTTAQPNTGEFYNNTYDEIPSGVCKLKVTGSIVPGVIVTGVSGGVTNCDIYPVYVDFYIGSDNVLQISASSIKTIDEVTLFLTKGGTFSVTASMSTPATAAGGSAEDTKVNLNVYIKVLEV